MPTNFYYYFVTGLPDLLLDEGRQPVSCVEFADEAAMSLENEDFANFNLFRLPFDNRNLVGMIEQRGHIFDRRGSMEEAEIAAGLKSPAELPQYMQQFIESHRDGRPPHSGLSLADQLSWYFYETMTNHENQFVREWYRFDLNLRNILVALACRRNLPHLEVIATDRDPASSVLLCGRDEVADAILRSNAPDFGLSVQFPWIDRVLSIARNTPLDFEKGIDTLRWEILGELTTASYFRAETVFAFYLKLAMVERWRALDPKTGREHIDRLLSELGASYVMPSSF